MLGAFFKKEVSMKIPYLDLTIQYKALENQFQEAINKALREGQYILGPEVEASEKKLASFIGAPYCLTVASGTDALLMALLAENIQAGDEVIVPSFSFFATAEVVALIGAVPIFADIEPDTFNIDVERMERLITKKTKAIIPVSLYGQVADMDPIVAIAKKHGLVVIEDGAQSFGARYNDRSSCNLSEYGCTSFFPAKPLGCFGDGGAIFCQTEEQFKVLSQIRVHGQESRYFHTRIGFNCRLDTIQCAVLLVKLERYPWEISQRQKVASIYDREFVNVEQVITPVIRPGHESVYAQYTVKVDNRDAFQKGLAELGVPTSVHYPKGMHEQPALAQYRPNRRLDVTETICNQVISLPLYADMPDDHVAHVVASVRKVAKQLS